MSNISNNNVVAKLINTWVCNPKNTPAMQIIGAFTYGIILSPWSSGLFVLIISIITYELLFYLFTHGCPRYYNLFVRTTVIMSSVLGYIIGRTLSNDDILYQGVICFGKC